ncbi:MAG: hypothetical protein U0T73_05335 [Chitinophagales bacterium]
MDRNGGVTLTHFCWCAALSLAMLISMPALAQQNKVVRNYSSTDIYIPLKGREEVKLEPLPDTLKTHKEYRFKIRFSEKYKFSELLFDKGIAVRTDSVLRVVPSTRMAYGYDTSTLRIIGFSNNSRILLYHYFFVEAEQKSFPVIVPKAVMNITLNNLALERGEKYKRDNFTESSVFHFAENDSYDEDNIITGITVSLVNPAGNKNMYVKAERPSKEMMREIHNARPGTVCYIRLDVRNGKKNKSVWTRFTLV